MHQPDVMLPNQDARATVQDLLVKVLGWKALILYGDSSIVDRWHFVRTYLQPGSLRTLDAGCGSGAFTMYAAKIGNCSLGLLFDEINNRKACRRAAILGVTNAEFQRVDLRELGRFVSHLGQFDQVMCLECVEHIRNDQKPAPDLATLLKPSGTLILTTPYKYHRAYYSEILSSSEDGGHVRWGYTHDEMQAILATAGLTVVASDFISGFVTQKLASLRLWLHMCLHPILVWTLLFPLRALKILDKPLSCLLKYPYLAIGVVAVKQ